MANALAEARSPYLLQHKDNPVAWREWNEETLTAARQEDKPILLSVGYAACHWCHVMAHESFENPEIAALMNEHFINVKVDREERPDLDAIYQHALALMGDQGGWPLTMFLTPQGEPFWGGTYFPPEPRYGRPSFPQVLQQIDQLWRNNRERIAGSRDQLLAALQRLSQPAAGELPGAGTAERAARALAEHFDAIHGGLGGTPKFPQAPVLELIWRMGLRTGDPALRQRILHTLRRIAQGGIYDHLGGGFARYSTDAYWLVPHFEKMLYDNAQLLRLLGSAYAATGEPLFLERAEETVDWLRREMLIAGAFAASLDADSEGEEGKYYVWDAAEIDALLGADAPAFKLAYGVTAKGNWEEKNVLNRLHEPGLPAPEQAELLHHAHERLLQAREQRIPPARDDKILADWNGLMIWGLAEATGYCGRPEWLGMAGDALRVVRRELAGQQGNRLVHSSLHGRRLETAFVDDYAQMCLGAIALFEQLGDREVLEAARLWYAQAEADFLDPARGVYFQTTAEAGLVVRAVIGHDGPYPSGNATMAWVAARLWHLTGDEQYRERAQSILTAFAGEARRNPFAYGTLLSAGAFLEEAVQIVIVGEPASDRFLELHRIAAASPVPFRVILPMGAEVELPATHPAHGKRLVGGAATAYVCVGTVCEAPITEPGELRQRLAVAP